MQRGERDGHGQLDVVSWGCRRGGPRRGRGRAAHGDAFSVEHAGGVAARIRSETEGGATVRGSAVTGHQTRRLATEGTYARTDRICRELGSAPVRARR